MAEARENLQAENKMFCPYLGIPLVSGACYGLALTGRHGTRCVGLPKDWSSLEALVQ